jgi:predicted acylesterase/phospholipase RssA
MVSPAILPIAIEAPPSPATSSSAVAEVRVFVSFVGGDTGGLALLGALRALESLVGKPGQRPVKIVGYSGASSGAIVAALAAGGLTSRDISQRGSTRRPGARNSDFGMAGFPGPFGLGGWGSPRPVRWLMGLVAKMPLLARWELAAAAFGLVILLTFIALLWGGVAGAVAVVLAWALGIGAAVHDLRKPARLEDLRQTLMDCLRPRADDRAFAPRDLTFEDFTGDPRPVLKIIAADPRDGRPVIYAHDSAPQMAVADAVIASLRNPPALGDFDPDGARGPSGWTVAEAPAWPFHEAQALDTDAVAIGFHVAPAADEAPLAEGAGSGLGARPTSRNVSIALTPPRGRARFDRSGGGRCRALLDAETLALIMLDDRLFRFPAVYHRLCDLVRQEVQDVLALMTEDVLIRGLAPGWVRCAVAMPPAGDFRHSLATLCGAGYQDFADADLWWPIEYSLAGLAWTSRISQYEHDSPRAEKEMDRPQDRSLRRRLPRDLSWSLRVPIFGEGGPGVDPFLIVLVDGSDTLLTCQATANLVAALVDRIEAIFQPVVSQSQRGRNMARFESISLGGFDPIADSAVRGVVDWVAQRNAAHLAAIAEEARAAEEERRTRIDSIGDQNLKRGLRL